MYFSLVATSPNLPQLSVIKENEPNPLSSLCSHHLFLPIFSYCSFSAHHQPDMANSSWERVSECAAKQKLVVTEGGRKDRLLVSARLRATVRRICGSFPPAGHWESLAVAEWRAAPSAALCARVCVWVSWLFCMEKKKTI